MKIGMIGIINNLTTSIRSHNGGFTLVSKNILEQKFNDKIELLNEFSDLNKYDIIIINEGVNAQEGVFNIFGGVNDKLIKKIKLILDFKGILYSVNVLFKLDLLLQKRKELKNIKYIHKNIKTIDLYNGFNKIILGDSHSLSIYKPGYGLKRIDGKTLNGFLKIGLSNLIPNNVDDLIFYSGNIDIRFHINRFGGINEINKLLGELEKQLLGLKLKNISLVGLIPVESEERKLPKTGQYKGNNFYGNINDRRKYIIHFNIILKHICLSNKWNYLQWDLSYKDNLDFKYMEQRQSVHIRPEYYMYNKLFIN